MVFIEDKNILSLDVVLKRFKYLEPVISQYSELQCTFIINDRVISLDSSYSNPINTNIYNALEYHKRFFYKNSVYKQPLAKALGIKKGVPRPHILDATAGMLGDSILMNAMGCSITAVERNPVAYILSANALENYEFLTENRVSILFKDASDLEGEFDVIYFDPMYGDKNEKSLPKKEMRIFREVVGPDLDAKVSAKTLKCLTKRLVIKRPIKATPLIDKPSVSFSGKSTSYDVYL